MRLLSTLEASEGEPELRIEEFFGDNIPKYAILSHTWAETRNEVQYSDLFDRSYGAKTGLSKVQGAIRQARQDGCDHVWIDSVCIDKSSSSELSEAINSMYRWYQMSKICYVYLADVNASIPDDGDVDANAEFCQSRWWTRGWTLQELIAPRQLRFFSSSWTLLGDKYTLQNHITRISSISPSFLDGSSPLQAASVAKRMSWAASRTTTREEDIAYCLLGIFSVNMPMMYGERSRAFVRLQEEIIKNTDDHSIFAWRDKTTASPHGLLADHPRAFTGAGFMVSFFGWQGRKSFGMTNMGLDIELPVLESSGADIELPRIEDNGSLAKTIRSNPHSASSRLSEPIFRAVIACRSPESPRSFLALGLRALPGNPYMFTRVDCEILYGVGRTASPTKLYIPQDMSKTRWPLREHPYQCILIRSHEGVEAWTNVQNARRAKSLHAVISSGTIRQYDCYSLPDRNSIDRRMFVSEPYEASDRIFVIGQARNRIYGWIKFERAVDMAVIVLLVGRLLNGDMGFGILRVYDKEFEVSESLTYDLQPAGCWMNVGGLYPDSAQASDKGDATQAKFDAAIWLRSMFVHGEQVFDVDVSTNRRIVDRSKWTARIASFIDSRTPRTYQRGSSQ